MTEQQLAGRTAVVAGGSGGIGAAVVRRYAEQGATVHSLGRRQDALVAAVSAELVEARRVVPHAVDVTDPSAVRCCLEAVVETADVDVLVSAVGLNVPNRRLADLSPGDWDAIVATNLNSSFYLVHAALPSLRRSRGTVILIGSASAYWPNGSGAAYQATKVGLLGLTRAASYDEHARGVRFSTLSAGLVDTPHLARRATPPSEEVRMRALQPDDLASACLYLAGLPPSVHVPEIVMLPTDLQAPGRTEIPEAPA